MRDPSAGLTRPATKRGGGVVVHLPFHPTWLAQNNWAISACSLLVAGLVGTAGMGGGSVKRALVIGSLAGSLLAPRISERILRPPLALPLGAIGGRIVLG